MSGIINQIIGFLLAIIGFVVSFLPKCPFDSYLTSLENSTLANVMGMVNYFIPFYQFAGIATAWGAAILVWYIYTIPLRLGKVID